MRDGVIRRLVGKWLNAGVMEHGLVIHPETGVPQGGVISPMLSDIYLHEVPDSWFLNMVQPCLRRCIEQDLVAGSQDLAEMVGAAIK